MGRASVASSSQLRIIVLLLPQFVYLLDDPKKTQALAKVGLAYFSSLKVERLLSCAAPIVTTSLPSLTDLNIGESVRVCSVQLS